MLPCGSFCQVVKGQWSCWPSKLKADTLYHETMTLRTGFGLGFGITAAWLTRNALSCHTLARTFCCRKPGFLRRDLSDVQLDVADQKFRAFAVEPLDPGVSALSCFSCLDVLLFVTRFLRRRGEQFPTYAIWPAVESFLAQAWNWEM